MTKPVSTADKVQNAAIRAVLGVALMLPYETRVRVVGAVMSRIVSPLAGWRQRILSNLAYAWPDMSRAEQARIASTVADNVGRTLTYHNVVRKIAPIGRWDGKGTFRATANVPDDAPVVVLIQAGNGGVILGASRLR